MWAGCGKVVVRLWLCGRLWFLVFKVLKVVCEGCGCVGAAARRWEGCDDGTGVKVAETVELVCGSRWVRWVRGSRAGLCSTDSEARRRQSVGLQQRQRGWKVCLCVCGSK